jgi:hypothetical protein
LSETSPEEGLFEKEVHVVEEEERGEGVGGTGECGS